MILFEVIRWKNLLSTGNSWTEMRLDKEAMTLVIGKNGAGKSTLIDALCYVLFGKPFRKVNLAEIINSVNNAGTRVEIEFKIGSKQYKVCRGMRPQLFEVWENGTLLQQTAANGDYQGYLERVILGFNMKSFTQIVVVGSNSYTPFMKLGPQDRRAIIENLLDIEVFSAMNTVVKERLKTATKLLNESKDKIQSTTEKIDLQKKFIEESKKNHKQAIEAKEDELATIQTQISALEGNSIVVQSDIDELLQGVANEQQVRDNARKLETFRTKVESKVSDLEKENKFFEAHDVCPKCRQSLANKEDICKHNRSELEKLNEGLAQIQSKQDGVEKQIDALKELQSRINKRQLELRDMQARISELQKQSKRMIQQIESWREASAKPVSDDILRTKEELERTLTSFKSAKDEGLITKQYLDAAIILLKDDGIKSKIIKQYLPVINKLVNKYLADMDFFVDFHLDEEFKETIRSRHRDKFSYENFSEGQKRRIDLSLIFTWRAVAKLKNSVNTNLLILDEILDGSLDDDGMEEFMKLLSTFGTGANTFLISHRGDMLADKFNSVLKFKMTGLFSEVTIQ